MNPNFKTIAFSFLVLALAVGVGFFYNNERSAEAQAGGTGELSGYGWSSNIGWVSFAGPLYQVTIGDGGNFSGHAWSSNVGWLDMSGVRLVGGALVGNGNFLADGGGWDGKVSFSGTATNDGRDPYGVTVAPDGTFSGYAWGDDVVGWMNMSGVTADIGCTPGVDCQCGDPDYVPNPADECDTSCTPGVDCQCGDPDYVPNPADECDTTTTNDLSVDCSVDDNTITLTDANYPPIVTFTAVASDGTSPYFFPGWTKTNSNTAKREVTITSVTPTNLPSSVTVTDSSNPSDSALDQCPNVTVTDERTPCTTCGSELIFEITNGGWMKVVNPPNSVHDSTDVTITATTMGENIASVDLEVLPAGDGFLAELADNAQLSAVEHPSFVFIPDDTITQTDNSFEMHVHFPAKARGPSGNNLYNNNNRPITFTATAKDNAGVTVNTVTFTVRLQYLDPTIVQE